MAASGIPANLVQAQRERLAHIDFRIWFLGEVSRADICARFGVAPAGATRDLALSLGFGDGLGGGDGPMVPCEFPAPINRPATGTLACVTRAIASRSALSIDYVSVSGGASRREIVPLALYGVGSAALAPGYAPPGGKAP